jgi:hypothetical protein
MIVIGIVQLLIFPAGELKPSWKITANNHRWARLLTQQTSITVYCLPTKENKLSFSVFCCRKQTEVCRFRFPYKYNETAASTYIVRYLFIYVIDGQVRLVRLVCLKRGTLFVSFFVNKRANDKLPFAPIKENCLSFRFPLSVYTVYIRKTENGKREFVSLGRQTINGN